jgi:hypothetical protein
MDTLPERRLGPADVKFMKKLIRKQFRFFVQFYDAAHAKMKSLKGTYDSMPEDVDTAKDGYKKAFAQQRSLPDLYWKALASLLSITPDDLPSRAKVRKATAPKGDSMTAPDTLQPTPVDRPLQNQPGNLVARTTAPEPTQPPPDIPPRGNKSLADWFSDLSAKQIVASIGSIGFVPKNKIASLHKEFLDPQCISVLVMKLVYGPIDCFVRFYLIFGLGISRQAGNYRVLNVQLGLARRREEPLLRAMSATIGTDSTLRIEHAKKVARSDFEELLNWFGCVAYYFDWVLYHDVDQAFKQFSTEPNFRMRYKRLNWQLLRSLIEKFDACGCQSAVEVLTGLCFEDDYRRVLKADPVDFKEFFASFRNGQNKARLQKFLRRAKPGANPPTKG